MTSDLAKRGTGIFFHSSRIDGIAPIVSQMMVRSSLSEKRGFECECQFTRRPDLSFHATRKEGRTDGMVTVAIEVSTLDRRKREAILFGFGQGCNFTRRILQHAIRKKEERILLKNLATHEYKVD